MPCLASRSLARFTSSAVKSVTYLFQTKRNSTNCNPKPFTQTRAFSKSCVISSVITPRLNCFTAAPQAGSAPRSAAVAAPATNSRRCIFPSPRAHPSSRLEPRQSQCRIYVPELPSRIFVRSVLTCTRFFAEMKNENALPFGCARPDFCARYVATPRQHANCSSLGAHGRADATVQEDAGGQHHGELPDTTGI